MEKDSSEWSMKLSLQYTTQLHWCIIIMNLILYPEVFDRFHLSASIIHHSFIFILSHESLLHENASPFLLQGHTISLRWGWIHVPGAESGGDDWRLEISFLLFPSPPPSCLYLNNPLTFHYPFYWLNTEFFII